MLPKLVLLVAFGFVAVNAQYGVAGMYENLPLESTTPEASGEGSGHDGNSEDGFASGADAVAIDTDCSTKEDGLYAIGGCSPQFLTCSGGIARIMDCPANLIYDHRIVACEYSYNVPECSGVPQDVKSTQSYYPSEDTTVPTETTVNPYAPIEIETTPEPAQDVTVPAETTVNPYAPVDVETTPEPAQDVTVPAESTFNPYAPVDIETTTAPANDDTRSAVDRSCTGKADGFYSFGDCSDHYTACSNGYTIPMQCPARLAFDEARVICDYTMNVPECQNGSGYDQGSEETTTEASGELPYSNGYGYEESTTVAEDVPATEAYEVQTTADAYVAPYGFETTTAADVPTTTVEYVPEVVETTTAPYIEETTTDVPSTTVPYAEETTTTVGYTPEVIETTTVEETTTAADVPTTTYGYAPEVIETTTVEETTTAADVPTTPYVEETTTTAEYVPEVVETTTIPYVEGTTTAADEPTTTTVGYIPEVVETTTIPYVEETTTEAEVPTTTAEYIPKVVETTKAPYVEEATTEADVPTTTVEYTPEVIETTNAPYEETTTAADVPTTTVPSCVEGATAIEPCSQHYRNCVNGHEAIFICESGLFFSPEQGSCTTADQIAECNQSVQY